METVAGVAVAEARRIGMGEGKVEVQRVLDRGLGESHGDEVGKFQIACRRLGLEAWSRSLRRCI